jgi:DNA-binding CsgD family transcriptional regulator
MSARGDADDRVAEIAYHRFESLPVGDAATAVAWGERAADRAMRQYAWEDAASLYDRCLAVATADQLLDARARLQLLLRLASAQVQGFMIGPARESILAAVKIARSVGDPVSLARAALTMEGISDHLWAATGRALSEEALAALPPGDSALRVRLMALLATNGLWEITDVGPMSADALAMAERIGDRLALREALRARQMALSGPDGVHDRLALGGRLLEFAGSADDDAQLWARLWRFDAFAQLGDLIGAEKELAALASVAARLRSPIASWHVLRCRSALLGARGQLTEGFAVALAATDLARRASEGGALIPSNGMMALYVMQLGDPMPFPVDFVARHGMAPTATSFIAGIKTKWLLATGERAQAERLYRTLPAPSELPPMVRLPAGAWMAELGAEFDDKESADRVYRLLLPYADLLACGGAGVVQILGPIRQYLGIAAATAGRPDEAIRMLRAARTHAQRLGMPVAVAECTYHLARITAVSDKAGSAALATSAAAMAEQLGMRPLQQKARALMAGPPKSPLTAREREISTLVSQGLTNKQIAAAVHISERTAETHVQHILDKLGFANRSQIAAWVAGGIRTTDTWSH